MRFKIYYSLLVLSEVSFLKCYGHFRDLLRCPVAAEFDILATNVCLSPSNYFCLLCPTYGKYKCTDNRLGGRYVEGCTGPSIVRKGNKKIFAGSFTNEKCDDDRYQPITFNTSISTSCIYKKSFCNEEGQIIFNNGTSTTDRSCSCNYENGYAFVNYTDKDSFCSPSEYADCSCYVKPCNESQMLSQDNMCTSSERDESKDERSFPNKSTYAYPVFSVDTFHVDNITGKRLEFQIVTTTLVCILACVIFLCLYLVITEKATEWCVKKMPCIGKGIPVITIQHQSYSVKLGGSVTLETIISAYPLHTNVRWKKIQGGVTAVIDTDSFKYSGSTVNQPSLTINYADLNDNADYMCTALNDVGTGSSPATSLTICPGSKCTLEKMSRGCVFGIK